MVDGGPGRRNGALTSQTLAPFRRGTARVCRRCHGSLSSKDGHCPNCAPGAAEVEASAPDGKCVSCFRAVATARRACPHCGEPTPGQPKPTGKRLRRCRKCAKMVSIDAETCPGCGVDRPAPPAVVSTCASCKLPVDVPQGACPRCGAPDVHTRTTVVRCPRCEGPVSRALAHCPRCPYTASVSADELQHCAVCDQPLTSPDAPCMVCARRTQQQASRKGHCPHCGRRVAAGQACDCHGSAGLGTRIVRWVAPLRPLLTSKLMAVAIAVALGAAVWTWADDPESALAVRARARAMLGDQASDQELDRMTRDAEEIGVPLPWLLRAHRACVFDPDKRPPNKALKLVVEGARAAGSDPQQVLIAAVRSACAP